MFGNIRLPELVGMIFFAKYMIDMLNFHRLIVNNMYGISGVFFPRRCTNQDDNFPLNSSEFNGIEISNMSFSYYDKQVFTNFSAVLEKGTWIKIVGDNGSGKTTLCKLIAGMLLPTEGTIRVADLILNKQTQNYWKQQIIYKARTLHIFDYEVSFLKTSKI
ncbi:MAG: ATP-binding cassette domain-containing protein [Romboutsia sp.]|nr:ATP-binding cassette domain-containing protein [Romboutsia sp.]